MRFRVFAGIVAVAILVTLFLPGDANAQITRGAITGTIRDQSGAAVPGATITIKNAETGAVRTAVSDSIGFYRVSALEPGRYIVLTELSGFQSVETKDLQVRTASEVTLNVDLKVAGMGEALTVVGKAEAVELNKTNPTIGITSTTRQATELPLSANRNINNLVLLGPNTSSTGGQGTFAINGQRSRNNNYMIDGSDNNDISVTISTSQLPPESVAEFQVLTNPYSVEFGRNSGGQINAITKSGTNAFRGEAWEYYQTSDLYSLTNIEKANNLTSPARFNRHQFGADLGGPIIKDKTFFFVLYQRELQRPGPTLGGTVRIPTPAGFAALQGVPLGAGQTSASRQAVLERIAFLRDIHGQGVSFRNISSTLVNGVPIETGQTNIPNVGPSTYNTFVGRIDHRFSSKDNFTVRYTYNARADNNQISNCTFGTLFCGSQDLKDTNLAVSETHTFSPNLLNEFRFSWVKRNLDFPENDPSSPTATIGGFFTIGGASNFPQSRISDAFQFSDTMTWIKGKHTIKAGADVRYNKLLNNAAFDSKGTVGFNNLQDYMNNFAATFNTALQTASFTAKQWQTFFYLQDDFRPNPDLTLNLGLRYEVSTAPLGFFGATDAQSLAALVPAPVKKDKNNWAPRVGFAWSPSRGTGFFGDGKTVVRGGFGIGYDVLFYNLLTVNASNFPRVVVLQQQNVQNQYPNKPTGGATAVFNPLAGWVNSVEDTQNPDARYFSFSVGREIKDFVVEVGYTGSRNYHGINQGQGNPAILTAAQAATVIATRSVASIPSVQARRLYPQFGSRVLIPVYVGPGGGDFEARGSYDAVYLQLSKRFSHGLQFGASYTYSKNESNNDASLGEGGTGQSPQTPQDYFNYEAEWAVSAFDRPHRFVVNYIYELPGPKSGVLKQILGGWQISGVTQFQSGVPFTILTGVDSNGNGTSGADRPNMSGSCGVTWDDEHKGFTNGGCYSTPLGSNNLPLANTQPSGGSAGRNTERAASWWNTDLALIKRFFIGQHQLHVRVDAFNVFNQDNYGAPTANMNSLSFGLNNNNWGRRTVLLSGKFVW